MNGEHVFQRGNSYRLQRAESWIDSDCMRCDNPGFNTSAYPEFNARYLIEVSREGMDGALRQEALCEPCLHEAVRQGLTEEGAVVKVEPAEWDRIRSRHADE